MRSYSDLVDLPKGGWPWARLFGVPQQAAFYDGVFATCGALEGCAQFIKQQVEERRNPVELRASNVGNGQRTDAGLQSRDWQRVSHHAAREYKPC